VSEPLKTTDQVKEGEPKRTPATAKASTENFTTEAQAQPTEKFTTWSGEEPKKVLLAAKPGESLEEFTARTNQYHEELKRKTTEKPAIDPLSIGGFEDGSVVMAGGRQKPADKTDPPALKHEVAHKAVSVDPRPSYVEGLKAIGNNEEAQGLYSIEYMERKGIEALAAAQKTSLDLDQVLVADNDPEHGQVLLAQLNAKAEAGDKPRLEGYVSEPENHWQAFKNLTPEQRTEVIRILNNASQDTIDSMNQQGSDVLHGKPVIDFVLSIDRAVRALGTGAWKDNIAKICQDLQKIATGQPVGQQDPIEKNLTLGAGVLVKGVQGVDQVGQHAHPRAFARDTHATAEAMRQGIGTASEYYGKKIQNNDLGSIPGETMDAANYAKEKAAKAIEDFPAKDVTEQSNVLGAAATIVFLMAATRELITPEQARKMGLLNLTEEELEAQGIQKKRIKDMPPEDIVNPIDRAASTETKIAQLQALSRANEPIIKNFMRTIDETFGTTSEFSLKNPEDIRLKSIRPETLDKKPWFDIEHVRDSVRFRTPVHDLRDAHAIIKQLTESPFTIIKCDTESMVKPKERGWRAIHLDLRAPNGQLIEFQIVPDEMNKVGKGGHHSDYKRWREKDPAQMTKEERRSKQADTLRARKIADDAWNEHLSKNRLTPKEVMRILNDVSKEADL